MHVLLVHALIFQREGDVLGAAEGHELGIGILHHRSDLLVDRIDVRMLDIQTAYNNPALDLPAVGVRDEGVDGVTEGALPAP
ncbi:hypothetical protein SDC9_58197 [bioreactor metagenome]|uniref:Uncharacterized protein n=1 Tax=bioreactor metagenome TaxID=1076179 RepID=A0A644X6P7_9ZZZZ